MSLRLGALSPTSLQALDLGVSILSAFYAYYLPVFFALAVPTDKIWRTRRENRESRENKNGLLRMLALAISHWCLWLHFEQFFAYQVESQTIIMLENIFWMASQTIAGGVLLFSTAKIRGKPDRLDIWLWYKLEQPRLALLTGFDWKLAILAFEGIAIWKAWTGSAVAEFTWDIFHFAIAAGTIWEIHEFDKQKDPIALPIIHEADLQNDEQNNAVSANSVKDLEPVTVAARKAGCHLFTCTLLLLAEGVLQTAFFSFENLLLKLPPRYKLVAEVLVLLHIIMKEVLGILLPLLLMVHCIVVLATR